MKKGSFLNSLMLKEKLYSNMVPIVFCVVSLLGVYFSQLSPIFVINEVMIRFIRDGVLVLALLIPIVAGMGLNFAIIIGAIAGQVGILIVTDYQVNGVMGIVLAIIIGVVLSIILGNIVGYCLNKAKGKEMITTMIIGFLGTSIYQFIFQVGYGTFIKCHNKKILLSRGIGVRNMIDMEGIRNVFDKMLVIKIKGLEIPLGMILVVIGFACIIKYILNSKMGQKFKTVGESMEKAQEIGMNPFKVRTKAIVISTVIACFGQILYLENMGMLNVYTAHLNSDIFSCAALLAGGATIKKANIRNAFTGIILFHMLFVVSPQAGQNIFSNASLGEYFRTFIAYGTIAFALIMNVKNEKQTFKEV